MKYILYVTVNKVNNKIYIGYHEVNNIEVFDGYIGNGVNIFRPSTILNPRTNFQQAVKKYGFDAFRRYTLAVVDTEEEALMLESIIVSQAFVDRLDTYNMIVGGQEIHKAIIPVNQFNMDGSLVEKFPSIKIASERTGYNETGISIAMRAKKSFNNYFWSSQEEINPDDYSYISTDKKQVYKFSVTGELLKVYESTSDAAKDNDCVRESIRDAIRMMTKIHGYYFSYNPFFSKKFDSHTIIYRYNMNGSFIDSKELGEYSKELGIQEIKLYKAANSGAIHDGFQWNLNNVVKMQDKSKYSNPGKARKVGQYDFNGNLINIFSTVTECRKTFTNVKKVLNGQLTSTKGYIFKYIDE